MNFTELGLPIDPIYEHRQSRSFKTFCKNHLKAIILIIMTIVLINIILTICLISLSNRSNNKKNVSGTSATPTTRRTIKPYRTTQNPPGKERMQILYYTFLFISSVIQLI